jgi:hypothetical protein
VPSIYFKSFIFSPAVPIRIDYVGKYVDFTQVLHDGHKNTNTVTAHVFVFVYLYRFADGLLPRAP